MKYVAIAIAAAATALLPGEVADAQYFAQYRLQTASLGADGYPSCLQANYADSPDHAGGVFMTTCTISQNQHWQIEANNDRARSSSLKTGFGGPDICLDSNQASSLEHEGAAFMDACDTVTSQQWMIVDQPNRRVRLQTVAGGATLCLQSNQGPSDSAHAGAAFMAPCQDVPGQLWKVDWQ
jgi:hypothetical protein